MATNKLEVTMRGDMDSASLVARLIAQAVNGDLTGGVPLFMGYNINYTGMTVCPRIDLERRTGQDLEQEHEIIKRRLNALRAANRMPPVDIWKCGMVDSGCAPIHEVLEHQLNALRTEYGLQPLAVSAQGVVLPPEPAPVELVAIKAPFGKIRKAIREVLGHVVEIHKGVKELVHLARDAETRRKGQTINVTDDPLHGMEIEVQLEQVRKRDPEYHFHFKGRTFKANTGDSLLNRREALRQAAMTPDCDSDTLAKLVASIRDEEARRAIPKGRQ
ncbi:hypothetical protein DDSR119_52 [Pseudomonas phage DDSR119]|nr:hypothetical protein DDSR119_52 [Pseudomonas phage DDSR119]